MATISKNFVKVSKMSSCDTNYFKTLIMKTTNYVFWDMTLSHYIK